jgi:DNA polymerase elongation subunit (family B)
MLQNITIEKLLFIDIETVSGRNTYELLPDETQMLWAKKSSNLNLAAEPRESYGNSAAIYAEFGKIICISLAYFKNEDLHVTSFTGNNEIEVLENFATFIHDKKMVLCGHNIKEFDVPYICRRMLVHEIELPKMIDISGKKPWEVDFIDTLQLWKFGDYKSYTSLNLLANIFKIPCPKDDIDGSQVGQVYWQENNLERIVKYCEKDVITVVRLIQKWKRIQQIKDEDIIYQQAFT